VCKLNQVIVKVTFSANSNAEQSKEIVVYITKTGEKYHTGGLQLSEEKQYPCKVVRCKKTEDIHLAAGVIRQDRRIIMRLIVDRFEGDFAVCENENKEMINVCRSELPADVKEGDVLLKMNDKYVIDTAATEERKKKISRMMDELWE